MSCAVARVGARAAGVRGGSFIDHSISRIVLTVRTCGKNGNASGRNVHACANHSTKSTTTMASMRDE